MPEHDPAGDEPVGGLVEEAAKLMAAVMSERFARNDSEPEDDQEQASSPGSRSEAHGCPHGWCPVCHVADFARENPEMVGQVMASATEFLLVLREAVEMAMRPRDPS